MFHVGVAVVRMSVSLDPSVQIDEFGRGFPLDWFPGLGITMV